MAGDIHTCSWVGLPMFLSLPIKYIVIVRLPITFTQSNVPAGVVIFSFSATFREHELTRMVSLKIKTGIRFICHFTGTTVFLLDLKLIFKI